MRARTERMRLGVRMALFVLMLTASIAFMVSTLQPYKKLSGMRKDLADLQKQEMDVIERKDAKERELSALENDPDYLELIARDCLNFYKPGEHIFRIERKH